MHNKPFTYEESSRKQRKDEVRYRCWKINEKGNCLTKTEKVYDKKQDKKHQNYIAVYFHYEKGYKEQEEVLMCLLQEEGKSYMSEKCVTENKWHYNHVVTAA